MSNPNNPLVSVIVPIYTTERYAGTCIESILNQSYRNIEIILVDDGSTDKSPAICDLYASKDSRIKVVHKKHEGTVAARKTGLEAATGELVCYVDGDDWIGTGYIQRMAESLSGANADIAISGWTRTLFEQKAEILNNAMIGVYNGEKLKRLFSGMISEGAFFRSLLSPFLWNKMFRKEILYDCQMKADDSLWIGEDAAVSYPAILKSRTVVINDCTEYYFRQDEESLLRPGMDDASRRMKLKSLYEYMISVKEDEQWKSQVEDYVLASCIIRSGALNIPGIYESFDGKYFGKRTVIFSAGAFGQMIVSGIIKDKRCALAGWIDDDYREYRRCCLDVDPVESITEKEFDYLLIAAVDGQYAVEAKKRLIHYGVPEEKILTMNSIDGEKQELIQYYLYKGNE